MRKHLFAFCGLVGFGLSSAPAGAVPQVYVSANGVNAATCGSVASPCRSLQYAHNGRVDAGGVIAILGAGSFGPLRITKSVSVINEGPGAASVRGLRTGNAIVIDAKAADIVRLKGLTLDGQGVNANGVVFNSGARLEIDDLEARNFTDTAILFGALPNATLAISNTVVSRNGQYGVRVLGARNVQMNRVEAVSNTTGVYTQGAVETGISNASAVANETGMLITNTFNSNNVLSIANNIGISFTQSNSILSLITSASNSQGLDIFPVTAFSLSNNAIVDYFGTRPLTNLVLH